MLTICGRAEVILHGKGGTFFYKASAQRLSRIAATDGTC